jgi:hypothetical protein
VRRLIVVTLVLGLAADLWNLGTRAAGLLARPPNSAMFRHGRGGAGAPSRSYSDRL